MELNKRHTGLDLLRITAFLFVAGLHFFLNSGFYDQIVAGPRMYIMTVLRTLFMICVPLFLVLSGMVMEKKRPSKGYFLGVFKVVFIYVLASLCCGIYRVAVLQEALSPLQMITGILGFWLADYGWYVEMYIGLFLLIPFLNMGYDALQTQKSKKLLLLTMMVLTALPSMVNIWRVDGLDWWLRPSNIQYYHQIMPQYWVDLYPFTYFLLGRYLREYPLKLSKGMNLLLILAVMMASGAFGYYRSYGSTYIWGGWQAWGALTNVALAALVANFFAGLSLEKTPQKLRKTVATVSDWVFGAYLVSWIFDDALYRVLKENVTVMHYRLEWFPVVVPAVVLGALALSAVINGIYRFTGAKLIQFLRKKLDQ